MAPLLDMVVAKGCVDHNGIPQIIIGEKKSVNGH